MKRTLALFLILAAAASAQTCQRRFASKPWTWLNSNMCQQQWDEWQAAHPSHPFYKDKYFWTGVAIIGVSVFADNYTSSLNQPRYQEVGPLRNFTGPHPTDGQFAVAGSLGFATYFTLHVLEYKLSHQDPSMTWRQIGRWSIPGIAAGVHIPAAVNNVQLHSKPCIVLVPGQPAINVCTGKPAFQF